MPDHKPDGHTVLVAQDGGGVSELNADHMVFNRYRKKPVVIEAVRMTLPFKVETLEGVMQGDPGDFLIRGIQGELYPCKPGIFHASYEAE